MDRVNLRASLVIGVVGMLLISIIYFRPVSIEKNYSGYIFADNSEFEKSTEIKFPKKSLGSSAIILKSTISCFLSWVSSERSFNSNPSAIISNFVQWSLNKLNILSRSDLYSLNIGYFLLKDFSTFFIVGVKLHHLIKGVNRKFNRWPVASEPVNGFDVVN